MRQRALIFLSLICMGYTTVQNVHADPPFSGTIFLDPDIITESDPTTYQGVMDVGRGNRTMFDRRVNGWIYLNAFLFKASFSDGLEIEIQVNPEFGNATAALAEATKYAPVIGRLPTSLRADVKTVWIHKGTKPFGGGNNNLLIHTGQADQYSASGILEETLVHEAAHTSLDADHASAQGWLAAQVADGEFISTYARDNPNREDIAESFLPYLALRYRSERISQSLANSISQTIPNRIAYFYSQEFDMNPICSTNLFKRELLNKNYTPYINLTEPNAPGYTLPLNIDDIGNFSDVQSKLDLPKTATLIEQNGFTVVEHDFGLFDPNRDDIVKPYEYLRNINVPIFITADTLLHLYHIQFDETLKDIEERDFISDINDLTKALLSDALAAYELHTGDLKEAARRNVAYLAVAQELIDPNAQIPALVSDVVMNELAKIDAHEGFADSDIFIYKADYSQYMPRGHYTRSEQLKRYFRALMWYGRMAFLLKGSENWGPFSEALIGIYDAKIQTMQAVLLARSIDTVQVGQRSGREIWDRIYTITAFYVGLADDLTPYEYLDAVDKIFGSSFNPTDLEDEGDFFALKVELALLQSPEIYGGTGQIFISPPFTPESLNEVLKKTKGMRFMGQRFIPDSYMFQNLVFPQVGAYTGNSTPEPFTLFDNCRDYPCGLDVLAVLGSAQALIIMIEQGDTDYINYWQQFGELKAEFESFDLSCWNRNLYWGWLYSLQALIEGFGEGYPNFMRTQAWDKKELNAALASWTELRHDTILYAKQSYTPGRGSFPPKVTGYVEPVPELYGRLLALTQMTREGLTGYNALSVQATERLVNLEDILGRLIMIANKELTNQTLSEDDCEYIRNFGEILENAVLGVVDKGIKTTLIADVHTNINEGKVVEEGLGYVDLIIVACPVPDGSIFLAAGPVLSYYEFKHPMSDRLTDEAWRAILASPTKPDRPQWFQPLMQ